MKQDILPDLNKALDSFAWSEAERICKQLIGEVSKSATPYPFEQGKQILKALRRKRQFSLMEDVADALIQCGQSASEILRQYAQSLIDQGDLTAAQHVLASIVNDPKAPEEEKGEARGLMGRTYKQLYIDAQDPSNPRQQEKLRLAIQHYYDVYKTNPKSFLWHGINTVALLERANRDNVRVKGFPKASQIAKEIDDLIKQIEPLEYFDRATAIEVKVALKDSNSAYEHALHYAGDKRADAFEIASLVRQLTEVWQLTTDAEPGNMLLPILQAALLKRQGGTVSIKPKELTAKANNAHKASEQLSKTKGLEKVFADFGYQPFAWLETAIKRCKAVGRVETVSGRSIGTGFLVRAADFFPKRDKNELLFLTNAHVISPDDKPFPGAISPATGRVLFEATGKTYPIRDVVWSSPPKDLDATFVTIDGIAKSAELCPLVPAPEKFNAKKKPRVYVIGYPLGGGLSISLQDSIWLDTNEKLLHYRTPTEPGSSGSPVFDQEYWTVLALHHSGRSDMPRLRGRGVYEANEGISVAAIQEATRKAPVPAKRKLQRRG